MAKNPLSGYYRQSLYNCSGNMMSLKFYLKQPFLYGLSLIFVLVDQLTKYWAQLTLGSEPIIPFPTVIFSLTYNKGVAFGIFGDKGDLGRWLLIVIASSVVVGIAYLLYKIKDSANGLRKLALALIAGGTLGNLIDRLQYGAVVDFITLAHGSYHWPTIFNVADMFITLGAILLIIDTFVSPE